MGKFKISDPMRLFTLIVSALFVAIGVMAIASGNSDGWLIAGFFGLCLLVAIFEPWFSKPWVTCDYRLVMTKDEIACEHPKRQRESIRWENVTAREALTALLGNYDLMLVETQPGAETSRPDNPA